MVCQGWREVVFSLADARRALPYVARIAEDAADAFRAAQTCRALLARRLTDRERNHYCERRDRELGRLNAAIDDCNNVGADLIDIPCGVVRFNARVRGESTALIWRIGEPVANAWSELDDR